MDGLAKVLLIGGGAYLLYRSGLLNGLFGASSIATSSGATSSPTASPTNPTAPSPVNPSTPPPATPTWQLVLNAATAANPGKSPLLLSFDQWNYFLQQVTGVPGPAPDSIAAIGPVGTATRSSLLQVSQWWAYVQQLQPGLGGLGVVVGRPRRSGFGDPGPMWPGSWGGGFSGFVPASSSYCGPADTVAAMQPPVNSQTPTPGPCNSGMGRWIY